MIVSARYGTLLLLVLLLAGCATPVVETAQDGNLAWSATSPALPTTDPRYAITEPVPAGTQVALTAPRINLAIDTRSETRRITEARLYTDSNGLPLIELPAAPPRALSQGEDAVAALEWTLERVRERESRLEIDGSPWLDRRSDQLFPSRPVIYIYFYALGSGTQVHLEREDEDQPFPVTVQRELLDSLFTELAASS